VEDATSYTNYNEEKMKLSMNYAQYEENIEIKSLSEIEQYMIAFANKHGLTSKCWISFYITGDFNVKSILNYENDIEALFG
jgi:hypothetical protein